MDDLKRVGIELSDELHRTVKSVAAQHGMKFRDATAEAYQLWLATMKADKEPAQRSPYRRTAEWHDLLEYVLQNDKKAAESLKVNLRLMAEAIESRKGRTRARRARGA